VRRNNQTNSTAKGTGTDRLSPHELPVVRPPLRRADLPAVYILLELGVHPDASELFRFHHLYDDKSIFLSGFVKHEHFYLPITPLDVVP
jgi:hypothetical protein